MRRSVDWAGIAALCGWLVPLLLALSWVGLSRLSAPRIRALVIASAGLLGECLLAEERAAEPLLATELVPRPQP